MSERDIVIALVLGVLLPALIGRPAMLVEHPMSDHIRRRWCIAYTMFAFGGAAYVYTAAVTLLRPTEGFSARAEHAVGGAGLLIFVLLCFNHVPPLLVPRRSHLTKTLQVGGAIVCGILGGGFFGVDQIFPRSFPHTPAISYISWGVLIVVMVGLCLWYGPSPEHRLIVFRVKRRLRRWRKRRKAS
jgi:hypothetical protein